MKGITTDDRPEDIQASYYRNMHNYTVRDMIYKNAMDKLTLGKNSINPLANATIKMLDAGYTESQIINQLIDTGGEIYKKFITVCEAWPFPYAQFPLNEKS